MSVYYFAYGSNMLSERMSKRIPESEIVDVASLFGWKFVWDKISKDNSAKANLITQEGSTVWGIVYRLPDAKLDNLDKVEGGYRRIIVAVDQVHGEKIHAFTYVSENRTTNLLPFDWYKTIVLDGAQEHSLPPEYVDEIRQIIAKPDARDVAGEYNEA